MTCHGHGRHAYVRCNAILANSHTAYLGNSIYVLTSASRLLGNLSLDGGAS